MATAGVKTVMGVIGPDNGGAGPDTIFLISDDEAKDVGVIEGLFYEAALPGLH